MTTIGKAVSAAAILLCCINDIPVKGGPLSDSAKVSSSPERKGKNENIAIAIAALKQAKRFETSVVGEGTPSRIYPHYKTLCSTGNVCNDQLWNAVNTGTPAGKLFAASALFSHNQSEGKKALEQLTKEKDAVQFQSGCEVSNATVEEIASALLKTGAYMDFFLPKAK